MGFSNLNHLTRTLLFLALSKVFLSCWNEQKVPPHTSGGSIYNIGLKTNRYVPLWSDRTLQSVHPELQCLQCDRTLGNIRSALTGRVRSTLVRFQRGKITTGHVRSVLTGHWPASGHTENTGVRGVLTGVSGQHDRSVRSPRRGT